MTPGTLVYVEWPHSDVGASKPRPALVISAPDRQGDVTLLKVTGGSGYPESIPLITEDLEMGTMHKPSYIRLDRFLTVHLDCLDVQSKRVGKAKLKEIYKALAVDNSRAFSRLAHISNRPGDDSLRPDVDSTSQPLNPSTDREAIAAPYAGRVFTEDEVEAAVSSTLDFWLTLGKEGEALEKELADFMGVKKSILTNSGSSANLLAFSALTSHKIPEERRILPGDEVITCAAGFPTTVTPIIQNRAVPVFIDNLPHTGNADTSQLEAAYVPGKTKAVMLAHALGNPFNLAEVVAFCHKHNLWLIEDNCDALGCTYSLPVELAKKIGLEHLLKIAAKGVHPLIRFENPQPATRNPQLLTAPTGTWGDLSTQSFYPPHHLTMGEGGAINVVKDMKLKVLVESFRDWGRDCWCPSGKDNTCNKRFGWQLGELPEGYDHKYIYSHLGYNLKPLDPQAAIGRQQVKKLPAFIEARKRNWEVLRRGLADLEEYFEFSLPTHAAAWRPPVGVEGLKGGKVEEGWDQLASFNWTHDSTDQPLNPSTTNPPDLSCSPSWFGFMMLVRPEAPFSRTEFARYLDEKRIGNRMLFGGNLLRQPAFVQLKKDNPAAFRVVPDPQPALVTPKQSEGGTRNPQPEGSALPGADRIMNEAIFIGVYPGLGERQLEYMITAIQGFCTEATAG
jgi:CDP-6-deoxy-D-xylo-4-hexulose-3-dehydrase